MTDFRLAHAAGAEPAELAADCARQLTSAGDTEDAADHSLGFLYATSACADSLGEILATLKTTTPVKSWIGTIGFGICTTGTDYFGGPAIVAMTARFAPDEYRLIPSLTDPRAAAAATHHDFPAALGIVHGDPRNPETTEIVAAYAASSGAYLVGGLTSAERAFPQIAGNLAEGGISGALIGGRRRVTFGLTQGCTPIGVPHRVTAAQRNIIATLDDQPAFDVLLSDVGIPPEQDLQLALADIHAAIVLTSPDKGDYLVRNLVGIDVEKGLVAIADDLTDVDRIMFVRRGASAAAKDLERMLDDLEARMSAPPVAGLYYSCVARGPQLFPTPAHELRAIADRFGDIPIAGFYGNGEICADHVYAYTGVLTLFH